MKVDREDLAETFDLCAIDADIIVYRCAFVAQKTVYDIYDSDGAFHQTCNSKKDASYELERLEFLLQDTSDFNVEPRIVVEPVENAYEAVDTLISYIKQRVKAEDYKYYLTDSKTNYRNEVSTTRVYKGNRLDIPKPHHYQAVKDYLMDEYGAYMVVGQEADDAVSVLGCIKSKKTCVATIDKDLKGSPIIIYDFSEDAWYSIDEFEADCFFFKQCLTGDSTDNIAGVSELSREFRNKYSLGHRKGVGEKTAEKLIGRCSNTRELYSIVREAYVSMYGEEEGLERLNEMGKLLWMQRKKGVVFDVSWFEGGEADG